MIKDAPIGSPMFHLYNVLYLTFFTGLMTFGMLFVYYLTYEEANPTKDIEVMLGKNAVNYTIVQDNLTLESITNPDDLALVTAHFSGSSEVLRFFVRDIQTDEHVMTVFSVVTGGYGGPVKAFVGIDGDTIKALSVTEASSETAGLGQRITEMGFQQQFLNKTRDLLPMDKSSWGEHIDMISGATVSSASVVDNIVKAFDLHKVGGNN